LATFPAGGKQVSDQTPYESIELQGDPADQTIVGFKPELGLIDPERRRSIIDAAINQLSKDFGTPLLPEPLIAEAPDKKDAFFAITLIRLKPERTLEELQDEIRKDTYAGIGWAEPNASVRPAGFNDPLSSQQWALEALGVTDPWTVSPAPGHKTILGIIDSGLRRPGGGLHADLGLVEPLALSQPSGFFSQGEDRVGHGTFLAGTMAAKPDTTGIASPIDPTWNIHLLPVQFFSPRVSPNAAFAAYAIAYAASNPPPHRARIINASWHVAAGDAGLATLKAAIVLAKSFFDCLIVFAAGNDGTDNEIYPTYPANFGSDAALAGNVLTVAASDRYDAKAFFSNYGQNTVQIAAPGMRILTTGPYLDGAPRYTEYSGTSAAAAYVSAGAALVFALNPTWTSQEVVQHLLASAVTCKNLTLACIGGKRLSLGRAVYGPLKLTAPVAGSALPANTPANIAWTIDYNNPKLAQVSITFTEGGTAGTVHPLGTVGIGTSPFPWTPTSPPLPPLPVTGRITITPTAGNFPVKIEAVTITP
jgi:subtilisin family serine protease